MFIKFWTVEASRQVKFFESVAPYSQLGHTNQEDTSEQLIHPLVRAVRLTTLFSLHFCYPQKHGETNDSKLSLVIIINKIVMLMIGNSRTWIKFSTSSSISFILHQTMFVR